MAMSVMVVSDSTSIFFAFVIRSSICGCNLESAIYKFLLSFKFTDNNKEYMIYTKNESDDNGNVTIYVASVERNGDSDPKLGGVDSEDEWTRIKNVLKELSKNVE